MTTDAEIIETDADADRVQFIKHYLGLLTEIAPIPESLKTLPAHLLLEHGRAFKTNSKTYRGQRMTKKACYMNATRKMLRNPDLYYAEGYILVHGIPVEHAWCVDGWGNVIDPTLKRNENIGGYFGIVFDRGFVLRTASRQRVYGILPNNETLYTEGLPEGAVIEVGCSCAN